VKVENYLNDYEPLGYFEDYIKDFECIGCFEDNNLPQIDKNNYIIDSAYFYHKIIRKVDFGFTYSFILTHNNKPLTNYGVPYGSISYNLPKISYKKVELINNNEYIKLKLSDINKDFIFRTPKLYRDLDINIEELESFISYKMLIKYEILKLQ
jgi:hypothetical protein